MLSLKTENVGWRLARTLWSRRNIHYPTVVLIRECYAGSHCRKTCDQILIFRLFVAIQKSDPPPFKYCAIKSLLTENNSMFLYYFRCVVGTNASDFEFSVAKLTRLNRCLCLSRAMTLGCCPGSLLRHCSLDGT